MRRAARLAVVGLCALGCGTAAEGGGGGEHLPNRGIVPYTLIAFLRGTAPSNWLYPPTPDFQALSVGAPSALATDEGVALFGLGRLAGEPLLGRADSPDGVAFGPFDSVLSPVPEDARDPAVVVDAATHRWHLFLARADGLWHAESPDAGRTFALDAAPLLMPDADDPAEAGGLFAPSAVFVDGTLHLYYAARGLEADAPLVIRHTARPAAGGTFGPRTTLLAPGEGCLDVTGMPFTCWDGAGVGHPEVRAARTPTGRRVYRLMYTGDSGFVQSVGFAAAFAPDEPFTRYAYNPILKDKDAKLDRTSPSNVRLDDGYLLYFGLEGQRPAVGVAEDREGEPSDVF